MPGPVPGPGWDPDGGLAGPPVLGLDAAGGGCTAGDGSDPDGAGWDGPPGWLTAMDLAGADDLPVEHEPWPDRDNGPWPDVDPGRWQGEAAGPEGDPTPWSGGDARVGWPVFGEVPPSAQVAALLTSVGVGDLDEFDLVEAVAAWERIGAWAAAHQVKALADLVSRPMFARLSSLRDGLDPVRGAALEVSARLRVSLREAEQRIDLALALTRDSTATLAALGEGRVDYWRAKTLTDGIAVLADRSTARRVEDELLEVAGELSRAGLRARVAKTVAVADRPQPKNATPARDRTGRCGADPSRTGWARPGR
jgi:Domain of unknown function (DUF222)